MYATVHVYDNKSMIDLLPSRCYVYGMHEEGIEIEVVCEH